MKRQATDLEETSANLTYLTKDQYLEYIKNSKTQLRKCKQSKAKDIKIKNSDKLNAGKYVEKLAGGNIKWNSYSGNIWQFL